MHTQSGWRQTRERPKGWPGLRERDVREVTEVGRFIPPAEQKVKSGEGKYKHYLHKQMLLRSSQPKDERQQKCCNKGDSDLMKKLRISLWKRSGTRACEQPDVLKQPDVLSRGLIRVPSEVHSNPKKSTTLCTVYRKRMRKRRPQKQRKKQVSPKE